MTRPRFRRLTLALVLAGLGAGALWLFLPRGPADPERFLSRRETLTQASVRDSVAADGRRVRNLVLTGTGGLRVRARVSLPAESEGPHAALILQGGLRTGSRAIFEVPDPGPLVLASLDYPYRMPRRAGFFRVLRELPRMRAASEEAVAGIWLLLEYLESLPEVDPTRTVLVGGSLGAPFAAMAGALEPRFEGVALLYGGADLARILGGRIPYRFPPLRWLCVRLLEPWLDPMDPVHFLPLISPRPVLLVNGSADEEIPRTSVLRLHAAALEPKTIVWVDTPHRVQGDPELTAPVARAVWDWMEAWEWRPREADEP